MKKVFLCLFTLFYSVIKRAYAKEILPLKSELTNGNLKLKLKDLLMMKYLMQYYLLTV